MQNEEGKLEEHVMSLGPTPEHLRHVGELCEVLLERHVDFAAALQAKQGDALDAYLDAARNLLQDAPKQRPLPVYATGERTPDRLIGPDY